MWDPHRAFIGHHYFHIFKKNALLKENVCQLNTCFFTKAISLHKQVQGVIYGQLFHNIIVWVPYGSLVKSSCDGIRRKVAMRFIYHYKYYVIFLCVLI